MSEGNGKRTLVIGAGPCGLVALKTLRGVGVDALSYELSSVIGGQWVLNNPSGQSSAYESLQTNTTRVMSRFSDYDFSDIEPEYSSDAESKFLSRSAIVRWLNGYVEKFDLAPHIRLNTKVESMRPLGNGTSTTGWVVETNDPSTSATFASVVIATGNYWDPRITEIPGDFEGERIHASSYRTPTDPVAVKDKHVLVIGPGSTGCEIAAEIASAGASSVSLSARSGVVISPKIVDGAPLTESVPFLHPLEELPTALKLMPERIRRRLFHRISKIKMDRSLAQGSFSYEDAGLQEPPHPLAKRASVSQTIFPHFATGAVRGCAQAAELVGKEAILVDGTRVKADVVVESTGYHMTFPFVSQDLLDTTGDDLTLYRRIMAPKRTDLFVVGIARPVGSFWTMAEVQSQWIAEHLSGRSSFPTEREIKRATESVMGTAMLPAFYGDELRSDAKRRSGQVSAARRLVRKARERR